MVDEDDTPAEPERRPGAVILLPVDRKKGPKSDLPDRLPHPKNPLTSDQSAIRRACASRWVSNMTVMAREMTTPELVWTRPAINLWITGQRHPRYEYLEALATFFKTTVDAIRLPPGAIQIGERTILPNDALHSRLRAVIEAVDPELAKYLQ